MKIRAVLIYFFFLGLTVGLASCSVSEVQSPNDSIVIDSEENSKTSKEDSLVIWWQQAFVSEGNEAIAVANIC